MTRFASILFSSIFLLSCSNSTEPTRCYEYSRQLAITIPAKELDLDSINVVLIAPEDTAKIRLGKGDSVGSNDSISLNLTLKQCGTRPQAHSIRIEGYSDEKLIYLRKGTLIFGQIFDSVLMQDKDEDGIPDSWESNGYDLSGKHVDLKSMGANPNRKDVFVELDWMEDGQQSWKPLPEAIDKVVAAFRNAPVPNPDGTTGINLHIDSGQWGGGGNRIRYIPVLGKRDVKDSWLTDFYEVKKFDSSRYPVFHYCMFVRNYYSVTVHDGVIYSDTLSSGASINLPGQYFILSLGGDNGAYPGPSGGDSQSMLQATTFMHELGHNLGLRHGGNDEVNYKPNYLSVMNYSFQLSGVFKQGGNVVDYSRFNFPGLDESHLFEARGFGQNGSPEAELYGTKWWYYGNRLVTNSVAAEIDWNGNGISTDTNIEVNLNDDAKIEVLAPSIIDWLNLEYVLRTSPFFAIRTMSLAKSNRLIDLGAYECTPIIRR